MSSLLNKKPFLSVGFSLLELMVATFIIALLSGSLLTISLSLYKQYVLINTLNKKNFSLQQIINSLQNDFSSLEKINASLTLNLENNCIKKMCFQIQSASDLQSVTYFVENSSLYRTTDGNTGLLHKQLLSEISYINTHFYYQGAWQTTVSATLLQIEGVFFKIAMKNEEIYEVAIYLGGTE